MTLMYFQVFPSESLALKSYLMLYWGTGVLLRRPNEAKTQYFGSTHNQHKMAAPVSGIFGFIFIQSESMETCQTALFIPEVLKIKHKLPNKLLRSLWQTTTELKPSWGNKAKLQGIMGARGQMLTRDDRRFAVGGEMAVNWRSFSPCAQGGELYGRQISPTGANRLCLLQLERRF